MNETIYEYLKQVAKDKRYTNYTETGALVGLEAHNSILWGMLDEINIHEHREGRPMLSAVVISQEENMPGDGFFECGRGLGLFHGGDKLLFWINQLNVVWDYWSYR